VARFGFSSPLQQVGEFITAQPRSGVGGSQPAAQSSGNRLEHSIPEAVVDSFEAVGIDELLLPSGLNALWR